MVINAVTSHAPISSAGESTSRAISADTRKMPEPIIEPITNMVELVRPSPLTNSRSAASSALTITGLASTVIQKQVASCQLPVVSPSVGRPEYNVTSGQLLVVNQAVRVVAVFVMTFSTSLMIPYI